MVPIAVNRSGYVARITDAPSQAKYPSGTVERANAITAPAGTYSASGSK